MNKEQIKRFNRIKKQDEEYRKRNSPEGSGKQKPKKKKKRKRSSFRKRLNNRRVGIWKDYQHYCRSREFKIWKEAVLAKVNYKCKHCKGRASIAHHVKYRRWGTEKVSDGIAICYGCHNLEHYDKEIAKLMKAQFD